MKQIAIIGGGIVGMTAAYYLKKNGMDVVVYDADYAQGTRAAVGIICPWVSQRRHQAWYALASDGAAFYKTLVRDVSDPSFYRQTGTLIAHTTRLDALSELAFERAKTTPTMGNVQRLQKPALADYIPDYVTLEDALLIEGGAQIDGARLIEILQKDQNIPVIKEQTTVERLETCGQFDHIIVAAGPWINDAQKKYIFDVKPQKGQLVTLQNAFDIDKAYPVIMPQGEIDILFDQTMLVIGASHDNEAGFDTHRDLNVEARLIHDAQMYIPKITSADITGFRIGTRAYTSDFAPFYGPIDTTKKVYVASGLGSSGLTTGPIIGYRIASDILGSTFDFSEMSPTKYIKSIV